MFNYFNDFTVIQLTFKHGPNNNTLVRVLVYWKFLLTTDNWSKFTGSMCPFSDLHVFLLGLHGTQSLRQLVDHFMQLLSLLCKTNLINPEWFKNCLMSVYLTRWFRRAKFISYYEVFKCLPLKSLSYEALGHQLWTLGTCSSWTRPYSQNNNYRHHHDQPKMCICRMFHARLCTTPGCPGR